MKQDTDFREYTIREAAKSLTAIEIHLKQADQDSVFCNECVQKHFLEVQKFAEEGAGFFPEDAQWWEDLERWGRESARILTETKFRPDHFQDAARDVGSETRCRRKLLIEMLEREIMKAGAEDVGVSEEEAHRYLMQLSGLDETSLKGVKTVLAGNDGQQAYSADLGCLGACGLPHADEANLGAIFADKEALDRAKKAGCTCIVLDEEKGSRICWAKGGVGALSKEQQSKICTVKNTQTRKASKRSGIGKTVDVFRRSNLVCRANARAQVDPDASDKAVQEFALYTGCMSRALHERKPPKRVKVTKIVPKKTVPAEGPLIVEV